MVLYLYCHDKYEKQFWSKRKSKVIAAEGEHKASRALRHAAEVIAESPSALQVNIEISCFKNECLASWSWIYHIFFLFGFPHYCAACQHQSACKTTVPWHCRATSCRVHTVLVATRALVTWWLFQSTRLCHMCATATIHMTTALALASLMDASSYEY